MSGGPGTGRSSAGPVSGTGSAAESAGGMIYRIVWVPGSDRLRGYCWCGSPCEAEDPVELWQWLLDHPDQHDDRDATRPEQRLPDSPDRHLAGTPA
jgi:hypothetical protein